MHSIFRKISPICHFQNFEKNYQNIKFSAFCKNERVYVDDKIQTPTTGLIYLWKELRSYHHKVDWILKRTSWVNAFVEQKREPKFRSRFWPVFSLFSCIIYTIVSEATFVGAMLKNNMKLETRKKKMVHWNMTVRRIGTHKGLRRKGGPFPSDGLLCDVKSIIIVHILGGKNKKWWTKTDGLIP